MDSSRTSDFWWLSAEQASQAWLIGLGHHRENDDRRITYYPDPNRPALLDWVHSLGEQDEPSEVFKLYPLSFISQWRARWNHHNVYRTMKLFPESGGGEAILGPLLVDIDSQDWESQPLEDLNDTLRIARRAIALVVQRWGVKPEDDVRVFFSGRKGFNIEVIPSRLGIAGDIDQQIGRSVGCLDTIRQELGISAAGPTIDPVYGNRHGFRLKHPYIRLHDSFNCWRSNAMPQCHRRVRLTIDELGDLSIKRILQLADASP